MADDHVLVKLSPRVSTTDTDAEDTLTSVDGVQRVSRIFPNAKSPQRDERILSPSGALRPKPDLTLWYQAQLTNTAEPETVVEALRQRGDVAYAEPDYLRKPVGNWHAHGMTLGLSRRSPAEILALPGPSTDPLYDQQWHLGATNVPQAWQWLEDHGYEPGGSRDLVVAVIDTGVDYTHPDLATNIWVNPAEFNGDPDVDDDGNGYVDDIHGADTVTPDGDPIDDHGHGTHVAGIIAAQANNSEGGVGIAYNTQIMVLKAAQYSGVLASSDIAEAINYAVDKGADVINMSFGGYARSQVEEDALAVAFGQAVLVGAAGNDGKVNLPCPFGRDMYPAAYNWVLGVMAHTESPNIEGDYMAGFSNFDCESQDSHEYELMAPGVDVWSTLPDGQYAAWDGTSMAAPVVSGIAALARTRWYTKSVYSSRFIMGQLATTGPLKQAYMPVEGSAVYHHVPDAYVALTIYPEPELSYLEHWLFDTEMQSDLNDDDGIVDAGETVDLGIVIRNHWGKADPVTVTLEARAEGAFQPDPYVEMITDTVSYGAVGSFNIDDNGLIYDDDGAAIGVEHPFRFTTAITTPNDHLIPFRLTMTYRNGLVPDDTLTYTTESRFYMLVQRGTEIPTIISEDMVLSSDRLWIIPDQTLVEAGVAVTVTAGTQIQFYSAEPLDPYASDPLAMLVVQGSLRATGTLTEPVEMFLSPNYETLVTEVRESDGGLVELRYVRMDDPKVEASLVDHCYFWASDGDTGYSPNGEILPWRYWHYVEASEISASIFEELGVLKHTHVGWFGFSADRPGNIEFAGSLETSYIGQSFFRALADDAGTYSLRNNVFLNNTRLYHGSNDDYLDDTVSFSQGIGAAPAITRSNLSGQSARS